MVAPQRIQRFEVMGHLGAGGMGAVYRARDPQLERDVAIKVLIHATAPPDLAADDTIDLRSDVLATRDHLLREARIMAKLSHPNVLPVYEVGVHDGAVFVVMELIEGQDLLQWLAEPRTTEQILSVFAQAGRGLAAAHELGIVHRDFKPANVLIGRDGRARVADFGLSKLDTRSTQAMRQVHELAGTPRFMAPELWDGVQATSKSDVFAFCRALDDAFGAESTQDEAASARDRRLRDRGIPAPARMTIAAGLAEEPEGRPELVAVIAAIERRRSRRAWWLAGIGAAAITASVAVAVMVPSDAPTCELDMSRYAGIWDDARRAELRAHASKTSGKADVAIGSLDEKQREIADHVLATCNARRDEKITEEQASVRRSCLERRVFELDATIQRLLAIPWDAKISPMRAGKIASARDCEEIVAPVLPPDPRPIQALYLQWVTAYELGTPATSKQHEKALAELEADARRLGEPEIGARAAHDMGFEMRFQDRYKDADAAFQREHKLAIEIHANRYAIVALVERSILATFSQDSAAARGYAELARDVADKWRTPSILRTRVFAALGSAQAERGDHKLAAETLARGLEHLKEGGKPAPFVELEMRFKLIRSLVEIEGREREAVKVATDTLEMVKTTIGESNSNYGLALGELAMALRANHDIAGAVAYRRRAVEKLRTTLSVNNAGIMLQRGALANDLIELGEFEHARRELLEFAAQADSNEGLKAHRPEFLEVTARATFALGRHEDAIRLVEQAHEDATSQHGKDHPKTLAIRMTTAALELELGHLDVAERTIAAIDRGLRIKPDEHKRALLQLDGVYRAQLANQRGDHALAEKLVGDALLAWTELSGNDLVRIDMNYNLGTSLAGQRRWEEARVALGKALELGRKRKLRADRLAAIEVSLARAEAGLGKPDAAARARRARGILEKFPGQVLARREADELLARPAPRGRRR